MSTHLTSKICGLCIACVGVCGQGRDSRERRKKAKCMKQTWEMKKLFLPPRGHLNIPLHCMIIVQIFVCVLSNLLHGSANCKGRDTKFYTSDPNLTNVGLVSFSLNCLPNLATKLWTMHCFQCLNSKSHQNILTKRVRRSIKRIIPQMRLKLRTFRFKSRHWTNWATDYSHKLKYLKDWFT